MKTLKEDVITYLTEKFTDSNVLFIGEGWTSLAFLIDDNIFRFPKYSIEWYLREVEILSVVKKYIKIQIPDIKIITDGNYCYSVHKSILGHHWSLDEYTSLESNLKRNFVTDCANFLFDLHSIPLSEFKNIRSKPCLIPPKFRQKDEIYPLLLTYIPLEILNIIYDKYRIACDKCVPDPVFLHKDFEGKNSVVNEDYRLTGIFDFGNSDIGDRTREFAFLYNPEYPEFLNDLLIYYNKISGTQIKLQDVQNYMLRSIINSMPELYDPELESIRDEVVEKRCKKIMFFADYFL
ncbi:MAG TPA: aminoglycoside phosphotransferase family protein [Alphaproteobacteria bacterium]|nr:aminoglycoside phosphotransferase family protein [Alphaproteobacteria bacterium]